MTPPLSETMTETTCGRLIEPFIRALAGRPDLPEVQVIGGNGSAALLDRRTVIDLDRRTILAPAACDLPRYRPDGTLRDLDALVLSTDRRQIDRVEALADDVIGDGLAISIFGLKPLDDLERQRAQPLRSTAFVFLGDRYVTTSSDHSGRLVDLAGFKALYPFQAPIGLDTVETFQLHLGDGPATPTAHPGATILNYLTRSISGLRAKDRAKVDTMTERVLTGCPAVADWITEGPGQDLLSLARSLHTLRQPGHEAKTLRIGNQLDLAPYTRDELENHPGFMANHLGPAGRRTIIELARLKSRAVGQAESHPMLVTSWQRHIEHRLRAIVHNDRRGDHDV